ncbi:MAG: Allophanate hydrolase 2 subunit 1, partial [Myxococcaceae bacterium]|nr:Allophanate hydrolase 2 subunit 1 [Myxococcaceae bacterium]
RRALFFTLRALPGVVDVILAEDTGAVLLAPSTPRAPLLTALALALAPAPALAPALALAHHTIRVVYDGDDLPLIASATGLSIDAVIALHAATDYEVAMLGFLPGFAYLRGLDPRLVLPRRSEPRTRVPAGSVAVAAEYTGIYPFASPGGWNLLGRVVDHRAFGPSGATLALGDRVRFVPDPGSSPNDPGSAPNDPGSGRDDPGSSPNDPGSGLEVRRVAGPAIVVDGGRVGHMHEGVPHGGAMVPERLARANAAAGNTAGAAAIEVYGMVEVIARGGSVTVGDDVRGRHVLRDGEAIVVATEGRARVRYLAVRGGIDVPVVLGGRGTLLVAGIGGYRGRALRRGDVIASARADADANANANEDANEDEDEDAGAVVEVDVVDGPDVDERVMEVIAAATFRVGARSDRMGTRLEGEELPTHSMHDARERAPSRPMVAGAIELTPGGLVVLGPDHPTTGGYPVVAVVSARALGRLLARPIGAPIRLVRSGSKPT